jgi:Ni/Co efflux regulator RcnB
MLGALSLTLAAVAPPAPADPPGGVPPGLAKKGVSPYEWQTRKWRLGQPLPPGRWKRIRDHDRYGLPRPGDRYGYYVVDGDVLRVLIATREVVEAVGAVSALLDG